MFTDSRSIDDRATAASFDTAYHKYADTQDSWFDGTPQSIDSRLAACRRLANIARTHVARRGAQEGPLSRLGELEADARALTALRQELLTGAADRVDDSPIAGVRIASDESDWHDLGDMTVEELLELLKAQIAAQANAAHHHANCGDDEEFAGGEHDEDESDRRKESALSPQDRRFVTLESSRFLSDNTDTNDARELATRAMHYAQKATSTYDVARSRAITSAFVEKVAEGGKLRQHLLLPLLEGVGEGMEGIEDGPVGGAGHEFLKGLGIGFREGIPDRAASTLPPEALYL